MHVSVLLNESIENLNIKEDGIYVDCTLGSPYLPVESKAHIPRSFHLIPS